MTFQGHVMFDKDVEVDPRKTNVVKNWKKPFSPTNIHRCLRFVFYYHMFLKHFSSIASSLIALTKNKSKY